MRTDPLGKRRVHDSLRGWSDGDGLWHLALPALGHPSDFRSESCDVILFFVQSCLCHEHGEIDVLNANLLEKLISELCNLLPDVERGGTQDVASRDIVILNQFGLCNDL